MVSETVYLNFHDNITIESAHRFTIFYEKAIIEYQPKKLYFLFSSGGGSVESGVMLYNYLRALPQEITMHNIGSVDSIANAIFLAGEKRYATPISTFVLHGITWNFPQGASLTYAQMQETMSRFDAAEQVTAQIIGERTKLSAQEVRDLFQQGQSKSPSFAIEKGMIHEIKAAQIPEGAPVHSIVP